MELVFSKEVWLLASSFYNRDTKDLKKLKSFNWVKDCDGKTIEEAKALGYVIMPHWCVPNDHHFMSQLSDAQFDKFIDAVIEIRGLK